MLTALTDRDLALSPMFIDFLARYIDGADFKDERWPDQISEELVNPGPAMRRTAYTRMLRLLLDERGQSAIEKVYAWFHDLAVARPEPLEGLQRRFQFIAIVGLGRTGGSYLTAELYAALGYDPTLVPTVIAHDGFPEAQPFSLSGGANRWITSLLSLGEYLTMIDLYFGAHVTDRRIVVPKKLTKGVYAGGLFNSVFGETAEYFITIRHPIASCVSTYEKSGGLPPDGLLKFRSNMEQWIKRDLLVAGMAAAEIEQLDYFQAYARYWEQYYVNLAVSGLCANRRRIVVPYGKTHMEETGSGWHVRFGSGRQVAQFVAPGGIGRRHPQWLERADQAIERVACVWKMAGLPFPSAEIERCY